MTTQARFNSQSEFSSWLRKESRLDSREQSLNIMDIDNIVYMLQNYCMDAIMLLEEKTNKANPAWSQLSLMNTVDTMLRHGAAPAGQIYLGYHLVQFENQSPVDGRIYLNYNTITIDQFVKFLQFRAPMEIYNKSNTIV